MFLQLVMVFTPLSERLYKWLAVTSRPQKADYIVCLGGDYERLLWTASLYDRRIAPKVVVSNAPGAAEYMRDLLVHAGVPRDRILVDDRSHTTFDHPSGIAQIPGLDPKRHHLQIVTSPEHSRRVRAVFRKAGYEHITIYGGFDPVKEGTAQPGWRWRVQILPRLAYESTALIQYWLQGRI